MAQVYLLLQLFILAAMLALGTRIRRVTLVLIMFFVVSIAKKQKLTSRIIDGKDGDYETYQFVIRIEIQVNNLGFSHYQHLCTGAYLTPIWILTAAHCSPSINVDKLFRELEKENLKWVVRYGSVTPYENASLSHILSIKVHPSFKKYMSASTGVTTMNNDIALAKTSPVKLQRYAKLSAVDYSSLIGMEAITMGYGLTDGGHTLQTTLSMNKTLQVLNVIVNKCPKKYIKISYPTVCLSGICGEVVTICPGDSGGPLIHSSGIVGVNSMVRLDNCNPKLYKKRRRNYFNFVVGIICPVSPYIQWISNVIKQEAKHS